MLSIHFRVAIFSVLESGIKIEIEIKNEMKKLIQVERENLEKKRQE